MPSSQELTTMVESVRNQSQQLLQPGGELMAAIVAKPGLLSIFDDCIALMARTRLTYSAQLMQGGKVVADAETAVVDAKTSPNGTTQQAYARSRVAVAQQFRQEWTGKLQARILNGARAKADGLVQRFIDAMSGIEAILDRMRLATIEPSSLRAGQTLEELLARSHLEADLEGMTTPDIEKLFWAEMRLNNSKFEQLLPVVFKLMRERASDEYIRAQTRKTAMPQRANYWSDEQATARLFRSRIDTIIRSRIDPDVSVWDETLQVQIAALTRLTLGVDVRQLNAQQFSEYSKNWKGGLKLSEQYVDSNWPMRLTLPQVDPRVRATLSAKLEP